jgi:hypothetical protein
MDNIERRKALGGPVFGTPARIYRGMRPRLTSTFDELIVYC